MGATYPPARAGFVAGAARSYARLAKRPSLDAPYRMECGDDSACAISIQAAKFQHFKISNEES